MMTALAMVSISLAIMACNTARQNSAPVFRVEPEVSLVDQEVAVKALCLAPGRVRRSDNERRA
jgi:glutamate racemase